mgnify:CR=1 FL=1
MFFVTGVSSLGLCLETGSFQIARSYRSRGLNPVDRQGKAVGILAPDCRPIHTLSDGVERLERFHRGDVLVDVRVLLTRAYR